MGLHTAFDLLSEIVACYERHGHTVRHVEATSDGGGCLRATLELPVASDGDDEPVLSPETATMTDDGGFTVELATAAPPLPTAVVSAVTVDDPSIRVAAAGEVVLAVTLVVDPTDAASRTVTDVGVEDDRSDDAGVGADRTDTGESRTGSAGDGSESTSDAATTSTRERPDGAEPAHETESDHGESADETAARLAAVRDDTLPPYEDTVYLERLYDSCETFAEMSRRIEMDVAGETVRRYMIDAGIHTPTSYRTARDEERSGGDQPDASPASDAADPEPAPDAAESATDSTGATVDGAESESESDAASAPTDDEETGATTAQHANAVDRIPTEEVVADGIGLPDGLRLEEVVDAVTESSTVYEVQRALDLEQRATWELLQQLGLLELLLGRLSDGPQEAVSQEAVTGRIRRRIAKSA